MLRFPCVSHIARNLALPLSGVEHRSHIPQLQYPRRDPLDRFIHLLRELCVRGIGKIAERVVHGLL